MTSTVERGEPFFFVFQQPAWLRGFLLAIAALLAGALVFLLKISLRGASGSMEDFWFIFGLATIQIAGIAAMVLLAFPSPASQANLEIQRNCIRFTPRRILRLIGEPVVESHIPPQSSEVLLCKSFSQGLYQGAQILFCGPGREQRALKVDYLVLLRARELKSLADGITAATGLPVRMIVRRSPASGTIEEEEWIPAHGAVSLVGLGLAALPYVGGILIGLIKPATAVIVATGFALWLILLLAAYFTTRRASNKPMFLTAQPLITVFTFAAGYALSVMMTIFMFHSQ